MNRFAERIARMLLVTGSTLAIPMAIMLLEDGSEGGSSDSGGSDGDSGSGGGQGGTGDAALRERMQNADRRASKAEQDLATAQQELEALRDKDRTEGERKDRQIQQLTQERDSMRDELRTSRGELAFLKSPHAKKFRNPGAALRLMDLEFDDDGKPTNLDAAVTALEESEPYLLVPKDEKSDGDKKEGEGSEGDQKDDDQQQLGSQGSAGQDKNKGTGVDREALMKKYPALRR